MRIEIAELAQVVIISASVITGAIVIWKKVIKPTIKNIKPYVDVVEKLNKLTKLLDDGMVDQKIVKLTVDNLIKLTDTPLFMCWASGTVVAANQALCDLFGADSEEKIIGYGMFNFFYYDQRAQAKSEWIECIKTDNQIEKIYTLVNPRTAAKTDVKLYVEITRNDKGVVLNILGKFKVLNAA